VKSRRLPAWFGRTLSRRSRCERTPDRCSFCSAITP
jgi:hypothetical protein